MSQDSAKPATLSANEKANAFLGALQARNFRSYGNNLPAVFAQMKAMDPLPGETVYADPRDDPAVKELETIVKFKTNNQQSPPDNFSTQ